MFLIIFKVKCDIFCDDVFCRSKFSSEMKNTPSWVEEQPKKLMVIDNSQLRSSGLWTVIESHPSAQPILAQVIRLFFGLSLVRG